MLFMDHVIVWQQLSHSFSIILKLNLNLFEDHHLQANQFFHILSNHHPLINMEVSLNSNNLISLFIILFLVSVFHCSFSSIFSHWFLFIYCHLFEGSFVFNLISFSFCHLCYLFIFVFLYFLLVIISFQIFIIV
jgi:hypothetical protein